MHSQDSLIFSPCDIDVHMLETDLRGEMTEGRALRLLSALLYPPQLLVHETRDIFHLSVECVLLWNWV